MQKSSDDVTWTNVPNATSLESSGATLGHEYFDFTDFNTRYLRLRCFGTNVNLMNTITEAEVWGK